MGAAGTMKSVCGSLSQADAKLGPVSYGHHVLLWVKNRHLPYVVVSTTPEKLKSCHTTFDCTGDLWHNSDSKKFVTLVRDHDLGAGQFGSGYFII